MMTNLNLNHYTVDLIQEHAFENVVCKMFAIYFRTIYVLIFLYVFQGRTEEM